MIKSVLRKGLQLSKVCLIFLCIFSLVCGQMVYAITDDLLDKYAANNIMFYDPDSCATDDTEGCISSDGSNLTVVGDSMAVRLKDSMKEKFAKLADDSYDALSGRTWDEGLAQAKTMTLKEIVVFMHGSNNHSPTLTQSDIQNAIDAIGANKTIVFVTNFMSGIDYDANNNLFKKAAESSDNIIVVDWAVIAKDHISDYLEPDKGHPNPTGAAKLTEMIYDTLNRPCMKNNVGAPENATLIASMDKVTFYSSDASENGGYAGQNASSAYNNGKLADGQVAESNSELELGDLVYVETSTSGEGSYANGKYFLVTDTGPSADTLDVFHDPASENESEPFGKGKNAKIYKVKSNVSWEDYLAQYYWGSVESSAWKSNNSATNLSAGSNKDYEGNQILSDDQLAQIKQNQSVYEQAAAEVGIPWQVLAVLHLREYGLKVANPSNGQGIYQLYSYTNGGTNSNRFPEGKVTQEEFLRQSKLAAQIFKDNEPELTETSTGDIVKRAFFKYNGTAKAYKTQARDLGFSEEEAENGEGSPYVMNKVDAKRDPAKHQNDNTWGQIKTDGGGIVYPANNDYGAYVVFAALGGGTGSSVCSNGMSAGNMSLNDTAIGLAWPVGDPHVGTMTPTDEYEAAYKQVGLDGIMPGGSSCDVFVATVARYSGVDPDFACCSVTNKQIPYLESSDKWEEITYSDPSDTSFLRPGDILTVAAIGSGHGHIKMYVEKDGVGLSAQASYGDHSGELSKGVRLTDSKRGNYRVWRFKG